MTIRARYRAAVLLFVFSLSVHSQNQGSSSSPVAIPSPERSAAPAVSTSAPAQSFSPIPVSDLITEAESLNSDLAAFEHALVDDPEISLIENQLPALTQTIALESARTKQLLSSAASIENLNRLINSWSRLGDSLPGWQSKLSARASELQAQMAALDRRKDTWVASLQAARQGDVPSGITSRAEGAISAIQATRDRVDARRKQLLTLQEQVATQTTVVNEMLASIKTQRDEALSRVFVQDSSPLWSGSAYTVGPAQLINEATVFYTAEWHLLKNYWYDHKLNFVLQGLFLIALLWPLRVARQRIQQWHAEEPNLLKTAKTFRLPFVLGLAIMALISGSFYSGAPRLLTVTLSVIALVSTVIILRPIVNPAILPALYALVPLSLLSGMVSILQGLPARLFGLVQVIAAILFLIWFIWQQRSRVADVTLQVQPQPRFLKPLSYVSLIGFVFSALANIAGFVPLAKIISITLLVSVYAAALLYGAIIIAQALVVFALRVKPLALSRAVRIHRVLIRQRLMRWISWLAVVFWVYVVLSQLAIADAVIKAGSSVLTYGLSIGRLNFTLGDILSFCLTIWLAIMISRLISFFLEEEVFSRVKVARGVPYAAIKVMQYVVVFIGFILALGAMGIDLTHLTILTGAVGVGLGFGLQKTINDFVSGLILLFERPVNVDDVVQIRDNTGTLQRIGLRASVLRTWQGSEVIVPNGDLISNEVINWTLSDQKRRLDIDVGVAYGTDPRVVMELLTKVATDHADVLDDPPPATLFGGFGDNALNFQLRAWTAQCDKWMQVRSDLAVGVNDSLTQANISIPFPQRTLHLQSIAPEALQALSANGSGPGRPGNLQPEESSSSK